MELEREVASPKKKPRNKTQAIDEIKSTEPAVEPIPAKEEREEKKLIPFRDMNFQIASMAELLGIARSSIYALEKEDLIKGKEVKAGITTRKVFNWDDFGTVSNRYSRRLVRSLQRKVKVFGNLKGGVGKSTVAVQVAMRISAMGYKVLVIDLDPQAHATLGFGRQFVDKNRPTIAHHWFNSTPIPLNQIIRMVTPLLGLIPSNLTLSSLENMLFLAEAREYFLRDTIAKIRDDWDLIVIDTNPSESTVNTNAILATDEVCIVAATDYLSVDGMAHYFSVLSRHFSKFKIQPAVRIIPNLYDIRDGIAQESLGTLRSTFGKYLTEVVIKKNTDIKECQKHEQAIWQYDKKSSGAKDIESLVEELLTEGGK